MTLPREVLVIKPDGTDTMKVSDVYRVFGIDDHKLANCINCGKGVNTATGDVYFDLPLD